MLGAVACFVAMVTCVKLLREGGMSTTETMVWRMGPGIPFLWLELQRTGARFWPHRPDVVGLRALFGSLAMGTYFWAVEGLSLFQNTIIQLTQPVFVALLAPVILREQLRGAALWSLPVALAGAVLVIISGPTVGTITLATVAMVPLLPGLLRLVSSLFSALAHMTIRLATTPNARMSGRPVDAPETVVIHFTLWVTLGGSALTLATGGFSVLSVSLSTGSTVWIIAAMAALGVTGQLMLSRAYAHTHAPSVAIVGYAAIPLSVLADVLVWDAALDWTHAAGTVVMLVAGFLLTRGGLRSDAD
jgi:drug/metabolite transporter (DMT)-like permease